MNKIKLLQENGVIIPDENNTYIANNVKVENIEPGVILYPGTRLEGERTLLGAGTSLGKEYGGFYCNVRCGRDVTLGSGTYNDCIFLDGAEVRTGAEIRGGTLFMEKARASHTVGCKMTIVGMYATLGSLINYCDVFVSGGTNKSYGFTEIGSGAVHYNFTPDGFKFASLIGPGAPGEMGIFPRVFIGGQTQVVAPVKIGSGSLIPAGVGVRENVPDNVLFSPSILPPGQKEYNANLITQPQKKFLLTAEIIIHYHILAHYYRHIKKKWALSHKDSFLKLLYEEAAKAIDKNIKERMGWLFSKTEQREKLDFFSKLEVSLVAHEKLYQKKKTCFHLDHIYQHENLIQKRKELQDYLVSVSLRISHLFADETLQKEFLSSQIANYTDFINLLDWEIRKNIAEEMKQHVIDNLGNLQDIIARDCVVQSPSWHQVQESCKNLEPFIADFCHLQQEQKILVDLRQISEKLVVINEKPIHHYTDIRYISGVLELWKIDFNAFEKIINTLKKISDEVIIDWHLLLDFVTTGNLNDIDSFVEKSLFRVHGTDGIRGNVYCYDFAITYTQAIQKYIVKGEMTPELCTLLAYASVCAYEKMYGQKAIIGVAKDTRNIFAGTKRSDCLYQALIEGALATNCEVYDFDAMPIANVPYTLAYFSTKKNHTINIILYKSASHNPASQDGLKIFMRDSEGNYVKASTRMENMITALMLILRNHSFAATKSVSKPMASMGHTIFENAVTHRENLPEIQNAKDSSIVCDLSHGALAVENYQKTLAKAIDLLGIKDRYWVGNNPDGKNINNNIGADRVGAGHFESLEEIKREHISEGGKYYGFPALAKLFSFKEHPEKNAFAIFMDGDGDRGITMLYNPFDDKCIVFDGDKSLFLQIYLAVKNKTLNLGDMVAFTVDSSVPFMNAIKKCMEQQYPVQFIVDDNTKASPDKINLKLTPVGDKYILKQQCFGGEKSGHIILENSVLSENNTPQKVYVGNGFLANIHTVAAVSSILNAENREQCFSEVAKLYDSPKSTTTYVYFVKKELWYHNSSVWNKVNDLLQEKYASFHLIATSFSEEPDTLYYCSQNEENEIQFSILARPSGTENKISVKFSGNSENIHLFNDISQEMFFLLALEMKNDALNSTQWEKSILEILDDQKKYSLDEIKKILQINNENAVQNTQFASVIEALAKQKIISFDGASLVITERGRKYCNILAKK